MRVAFKLCLALAGLMFLAASACEEESSSRPLGAMEPMGKIPQLKDSKGNEPNRQEFIKTSIALGCLPRIVKEKNLDSKGFNQEYRSILRRNRFRDRKHFEKTKAKYAMDREAASAIGIGIKNCMGLGTNSKRVQQVKSQIGTLPGVRRR